MSLLFSHVNAEHEHLPAGASLKRLAGLRRRHRTLSRPYGVITSAASRRSRTHQSLPMMGRLVTAAEPIFRLHHHTVHLFVVGNG